ncbi:carbohydrate ABC transporter substrate-binding protein, CUT1 family (TC 3.A.1.1.-) [Palleronia marisminoris]|uniref:Bacterial extracellular solute-binding protein n=1 Tax=Palleronia marisminoris TaxID=315423 RepID=A0A1Y5RLC1_9RHOB|nr:extracellular solute-binding protein [Palleronia marisminoris]SFG26344.1 carbohydrate ABC transporter substrate-binding protein, CUT1 family (TC 3.A.1.1.-) [Palleronia marisminoris]SLN20259.1 Bacterial extracellular solute-binding protein [Palleronia marisminoris]
MKLTTFAKATAFMALAGTAMPAYAQQTVTWWDFFAGGDGVRMKALIEQFNEEHPDIQIEGTTLEWGVPFYTKIRTSAAVGAGPDLMTYHLSRLPLGLSEEVLTPITEADLEAAGLSEDDFFESSINAAKGPDGTLYAVPFDIHSIVLYYNKSYLEGTRFLDDEGNLTGIESVADFEEAMQAAADNGSQTPVTYATGDDGGTYRVFYTLLAQQGGTLISEDGEVLPGDSTEKAVKALEIMTNWHEQGWQPEQALYEASVALFTSGQSAFQLNGVWEVPTMVDLAESGSLGFEWGAVEVPKLMDTQTTWADSHAWAIPIQGEEEMDPAKREAVMEVVGWMEKNAIQWADAGHIPAYKPVAESEEFAVMEPNATYASLAEDATYDPRSDVAGVASPVYDAAVNILSPAMHGYLSPEDAIEQMKAEIQNRM